MPRKKSNKTTKREQKQEQVNLLSEIDEKLLSAVSMGDLNAVIEALKNGANVNVHGQYGSTALKEASRNGNVEIVKCLLEAGADINDRGNTYDITPLMCAAFAGHVEVAQILLERGALVTRDLLSSLQMKVNILEENAECGMVYPEAVESWRQFLELFQVAQIRQLKPQTEHCSEIDAQLLKSANEGNLDQLKMAIQSGANVNVSDDQDISALRWAVQGGHYDAVKILLDAGANINQQSNSGWTALMQSVIAGNVEIVSLLIERGADSKLKTFDNLSALYFAHDIVPFSSDKESANQIIKILEAQGD